MTATVWKLLGLTVLSWSVAGLSAAEQYDWFALKSHFPEDLVFTGSVEYPRRAKISFEEKGRITFIAPAGKFLRGRILNDIGQVVKQGDVIAQQDTAGPQHNLELAKLRLSEAQASLTESEADYQRDLSLHKTEVISTKQYLQTKLKYDTAQVEFEKARVELEKARYVLDSCTVAAPFNCMISEIYYYPGTVVDNAQDVLEIVLLSPMKVVVPLSEQLTSQIDLTTSVKVFPVGAETPVAAWFDQKDVLTDRLNCYVENPLLPIGTLTAEERQLPRIDELSFVNESEPEPGRPVFWIDPPALHRDTAGEFVWKVTDAAAYDDKRPVTRSMTLKRVPVRSINMLTVQGVYRMQAIEPAPELSKFDLLANQVPAALTGDAAKVAYQAQMRQFRPGEQLQVNLRGNFELEGFYLPKKALLYNEDDAEYFLLAVAGGKAEKISVAKLGESMNYVRVNAPQLKDGLQIIVPRLGQKIEAGQVVQ